MLSDGARAVTVDRIVAVSGAPKGSVYPRFSTVNNLLATMWLRAVRRSQARFLKALDADGNPLEGAVDHAQAFMRTWGALQGPEESQLDAPEVGVYQVRDDRVVRSQMFHADSAAAAAFIREVGRTQETS